ncbi:archaellin/type IV pilin N-terminal domain-containing protein [Methanolobus mangrovi]|uniref:Flagellin n=1 Tax=Methanolobus mangrovi TaxID=3072977 RepID=A0AA51UH58_9EURY|nr:archaellin/type IV pilin N-terminal domain-containing protein [Methanolobus mangrovi]WMW23174.1 archaellin/type IV pilin N-terminal domain-containing protein [Methanolobus mangrovi]
MKANSKMCLQKDTHAQVGIGTLIIFIAMVLVAAVAASVLIQTSGILQQKAQATGKQSTQEVSSNLMIKGIEGARATDGTNVSGNISLLKLNVGLNVGSSPVDMNQVVISITDGTTTNNLVYGNNAKSYDVVMKDFSASNNASVNLQELLIDEQTPPGTNAKYFFTAEKIRDEDGSFTQEKPILNTGDLVTVYISTVASGDTAFTQVGSLATSGLKDSGLVIGPRGAVSIVLTPEAGATTVAEFVTPSSYGTLENVQLYP